MTAASQQFMLQRSTRRLFITGTDTGVGKTRVAVALVAAFRRAGRRVAAMKPIETGCARADGSLFAEDAARLAAAAPADPDLVCPIRLGPAASPAAAAALSGQSLDLATIPRAADALAADADLLVIEGAGGLLVPVAPGLFMADLAARLGARLLVVGRASLGTVNHTLLTIEAARRRQLPVAGVILSRVVAPRGVDEESNPEAIATLGQVPVFGTLPHLSGDPTDDALADQAARHLDLAALWAAL
jgi:dethiobiotin synthetase